MTKTLILMRHGKARRPEDGQLDADRQLTAYGKRALDAFLPTAFDFVPQNASVQIWSSPASRAQQTALAVQKACKKAGIETLSKMVLVDALWDQDLDAFIELVRSSDADVVFAVGHNPFIEEAVARLTGSHICFATGGFAALTFTNEGTGHAIGKLPENESIDEDAPELFDATVPPARLLWFVQGPQSQHWKTLTSMEHVLEDAAQTVKKRLDAFFADPDDVETMHKFRVSIRTLRSLLAFVAPWQQGTQNKGCQLALRDIVRQTSRLRELDVLTDMAREMEGASAELVAFCEGLALEERTRVSKALSSKQTTKTLNDVVKQLHQITWRRWVEAEGLSCAAVRQRFDALVRTLEQDIAALDLADEETTHDVRKNAKRVRYDAEQFEDLLGEDAVSIAKEMVSHQDNLGAICDARVNIDILGAIDTSALPDQVAWDLALLRAQNETFLYTALRER